MVDTTAARIAIPRAAWHHSDGSPVAPSRADGPAPADADADGRSEPHPFCHICRPPPHVMTHHILS